MVNSVVAGIMMDVVGITMDCVFGTILFVYVVIVGTVYGDVYRNLAVKLILLR